MVAASRPSSTVGVTKAVVGQRVGARARSSGRRPLLMARVWGRQDSGPVSWSVISLLDLGEELVDGLADGVELEQEAVVAVRALDDGVLDFLARRVEPV